MHEESIRIPLIEQVISGGEILNWASLFFIVEQSKGALQFALRWTDELSDYNFRIPEAIDWTLYGDAQDFFDLALHYYGAFVRKDLWT